ncbi:hypothetical protein CRM22_001250 [Opisthorchis felineus]|uniref:Cytosol aminopeptidase domain-containing protein n=1 Tax=Opisthorchis felineus TaxID=147828 RepID=A0A4S2MBD4_OPIFE|nr:hypothetical protein CRM22_001250 [Opisthorchis felineus]TGZ73884.1 hypothetical protein CRM22_001250 [Opisthorchis felineus]
MAHSLHYSTAFRRRWALQSLITIQKLCFTSNSESTVLHGFAGGGIILGNHGKRLTPALAYIDQTYLSGSVHDNLTNYKLFQRIRDTEIFYSTFEQNQFAVAVSPLPVTSCKNLRVSPDEVENPMDVVSRNSVRRCIGMGVHALQRRGTREILVDPCGDAEVAAEGAYLAAFVYDELKSVARQTIKPHITCYTNHLASSSSSGASVKEDMLAAWQRGRILAMSQNLARKWMEMPANYLSPSAFAQQAASVFDGMSQVRTNIRSSEWCREHRLNGLLSVGAGSRRHVAFVEIIYEGDPARCKNHVALVGKGVTFDSGGISLKRSTGMEEMRADMGGAAVVASTVYGLASLGVPVNVRAYLPLCENMPGGGAMRPGDVIRMANGLTVQVDNTDAEGRLILADALHIACKHPDFVGEEPSLIIDVATLTGAISAALGDEFTGVFSNHAASHKAAAAIWHSAEAPSSSLATETEEDIEPIEDTEDEEEVEVGLQIEQPLMRLSPARGPTLWDCLRTSATIRGDRVWNLPLLSTIPLCEQAHLADLVNVTGGSNAKKGGSGTAAAFLNFFVPRHIPWMHLDIAGVMRPDLRQGYMRKGMAGSKCIDAKPENVGCRSSPA